MKRRTWFIIIAVIVFAVVGFILIQAQRSRAAAQNVFQTVSVERGELVAIVGATGTVDANQTTILAWQTTGRIGEILVSLDEEVGRNQVLAELDKASLPQNIILAKADLVAARRSLENLKDSQTTKAQAELALAQAKIALEDALDDRESKDYKRASDNTLDGLRANYYLAEDAVDEAERLFTALEDRAEDDPGRAVALSALVNARKNRDRALYNLNYALGKPNEDEVAEASARVELAQANLEDAQREWDRLKDGPDPDDIAAAEARVESIEATIELAQLKAPFAGQVTMIESKVGDQVSPGTTSFRVDDLSHMLVDVQIPEVDISRVAVGQDVRLTFDAIRDKEYNGKVIEVARVGTISQAGVDFKVTIELSDEDDAVRPGMTAAVNIVVNRLDDVLLIPNRAVRFQDGKRVVYVQGTNPLMPEQIEIEIGASSDIYSEVLEGTLKEGDLIVLNPPIEFSPPAGRPGGMGN